ncbi:unnamed protein product [Toxocara canis]|uniref:DUF2382 domain-containing protein n=1 Tax=Toxocara canis TaxID=6265 RepID=A0A183V7M7_TOXCA|nr:unnamed protein product [Toxocara canis]
MVEKSEEREQRNEGEIAIDSTMRSVTRLPTALLTEETRQRVVVDGDTRVETAHRPTDVAMPQQTFYR